MVIRKLSPDEWELYRSLRLESLETEPQAFGSTLHETLQRPESYWRSRLEDATRDPTRLLLFAVVKGTPVGMLGSFPHQAPGIVNVISMYVSPSNRRTGVGQKLMESLLRELAGSDITELRLIVHEGQEAALALYRSFGFEVIRKYAAQRSDGSEMTRLEMSLANVSGTP